MMKLIARRKNEQEMSSEESLQFRIAENILDIKKRFREEVKKLPQIDSAPLPSLGRVPLEHPIYVRGRFVGEYLSQIVEIYSQIEDFENQIKIGQIDEKNNSLARLFREDVAYVETHLLGGQPSRTSKSAANICESYGWIYNNPGTILVGCC